MATINITVDSGEPLDVRRFAISEFVSGPFLIAVWVRSDNPSIDIEAIVGRPASFKIDSSRPAGPLNGIRSFSGVVREMALVHGALPTAVELSTYYLEIVPTIWLLSQRRNHRIFQDQSVPGIVESILKEWEIPFQMSIDAAAYPALATRVQYGESDFDFIQRLLEEAGIAFHFPESVTGSVFVTHDHLHETAPRSATPINYFHEPSQTKGAEFVTHARWSYRARPGAYAMADHDFRRPSFRLLGEADKAPAPQARQEHYRYLPGASLVQVAGESDTPGADARGRYRHDSDALRQQAQVSLQAQRADRRSLSFELSTVDLHPGLVFTLSGHPQLKEDQPLLCTAMSIVGAPNEQWVKTGTAVAADVPYRPAVKTPRPHVTSVQSAMVVGPDKTEILTDEFGRVRVQFSWDRDGKHNDKSSAWLRVSQGWAGSGYGWMTLPRIGQEVLIAFLDGNLDEPIVVGRVFNRTNPVPYKLPEKKTRSLDRSDSSVGSGGANELLFEDAAHKELLYLRAEKNLRSLVKHDDTSTVGVHRGKFVQAAETQTTLGRRTQVTHRDRIELTDGSRRELAEADRNKLVRGDEIVQIQEDRLLLVGQDRHVLVKEIRRELVIVDSHEQVEGSKAAAAGALSIATGGARHVKAGGHYLLEADDEIHFKTDTDFAAEAPDITLKGPGGFVRIDGSGVTIVGTVVKINAGGSPGSGAGAHPAQPEPPKEGLIEEPDKPPPALVGPPDHEIPPGPEITVTVAIKAEGGTKGGCRLLAQGKTHKYEAVGSPAGGSFKWAAKGNASIVGSTTDAIVEVRGNAVSGAIDDSELSVEYSAPAGKASDTLKLTIYAFTKIEAKLRATPCRRDGSRADAMPAKTSTKDDKTLDANTVTVVRGCGDLKLAATVKPAAVPVSWQVERAADDAAVLSGTPTHVRDGSADKRLLHTDATGSFHIHAFVDCDGDGKRGADEGGLIFNVNMVLIEVVAGIANNKQLKTDALFTAGRTTAGSLVVDSGTPSWPLAAHNAVYGDALLAQHAQAVKVAIKLTGGGADQRRGVSAVQTGYVRVATGDTFKGTYADGRTLKEVVAKNTATPDPIVAGTPTLIGYPVRDCRGATGNGLDVFGTSSSDADRTDLATGGQQRVTRNIDSPAVVLNKRHPVTGSALASISGYNAFAIILTGFSTDFDENFTVIALAHWKATYGSYTAAGGWSNAGANITGDSRLIVFRPSKRGEDVPDLERCAPNFVHNLRMDAR